MSPGRATAGDGLDGGELQRVHRVPQQQLHRRVPAQAARAHAVPLLLRLVLWRARRCVFGECGAAHSLRAEMTVPTGRDSAYR